MRVTAFAAISLAGSLTASIAAAQSSIGGGDQISVTEETAWFLGEQRTVASCLVVAADFPVDAAQITAIVTRSFARWSDYVRERELFWEVDGYPVAKRIAVADACIGNEDLTLYFGGIPAEVRAPLAKYHDPAAFAHRSSYDAAAGWGRGFIWFTSPRRYDLQFEDVSTPFDWRDSGELEAVIMHELGHVFGNRHVDGTVMREDLVNLLLSRRYLRLTNTPASPDTGADFDVLSGGSLAPLAEIDGRRQLTNSLGKHVANVDKQVFTFLTGRMPIGKPSATMNLRGAGPILDTTIELKDDVGAVSVPWRIYFGKASQQSAAMVFNKLIVDRLTGLTTVASEQQVVGVVHGTVRTSTNGSAAAALERNLHPAFANVLTINADGVLYRLVLRPAPAL
jgi:hypothetical protein